MNDTGVLLRAEGLTKDFTTKGDGAIRARTTRFRAVDDVGFSVRSGETLGIVGESGSGKSTTARMIAKLIEPTAGTITFDGEDVTTAKGSALAAFRTKVQVVFQDPFSSLNPRHTVERIVSAPLDYQGITPKQGKRALVRDLLDRVGLNPDHLQRYPRQFSGGQAQRIGIARALAVSPKLVICDEAVSALDVSVQARIIDLLRDLQAERGLSYLFIAHDLAVVRQIAHDVAVMHRGRVVEQGSREAIFDDPQDEYTKTLLAAVPTIDPSWEAARATMLEQERTSTGAAGRTDA
ncbi:peptide ABC transporter ATP-binding protein [Plantibacter sp. Leaf171]|uniref:ABC transporter ATP-binding protein n=1 Tax=unclassified Plantibacter TaxID=2624265 RepID=UPI0006F80511|nr:MULTISPECIES: ATP-binding cassette domain-containing protein [unclassified Plantibacter]KQM15917.1 peptide ABC transporter ATP-binding protein [Plantibacter sp. Leaf1]KQR59060.1 peptide ABC transporter ATP-binding protein [Plantibacter sp. Leaf171]